MVRRSSRNSRKKVADGQVTESVVTNPNIAKSDGDHDTDIDMIDSHDSIVLADTQSQPKVQSTNVLKLDSASTSSRPSFTELTPNTDTSDVHVAACKASTSGTSELPIENVALLENCLSRTEQEHNTITNTSNTSIGSTSASEKHSSQPVNIEHKTREEAVTVNTTTRKSKVDISVSSSSSGHAINSISKVNDKEMAKEVFELYKSISHNTMIPKGKPKSGRKWKTEQPVRFSDVKKDKSLRTSWGKKMKEKAEKKSIKMYERQLKETREQEIQKKKEYKANKLKRKQENEKKSEVVQVIRNTAKLKRMKKKQLRNIQKR